MSKYLIDSQTLTDIADAIRTKGGTSEEIQVSNFDTAIENLPSGADLSEYFTNTIIGGGSNNKATFKNLVINIPNTVIVSGTNLDYAFFEYHGTSIPLLDTSNVTSMMYTFQNCTNLTSIPLIDTSSVTAMHYMFSGCTALANVPVLDTSSLVSTGSATYQMPLNGIFYNCPSLTDTSLDNILQMCINASGIRYLKKLSQLGFTETDYPVSQIQALPHYQDFINAGWTIGY